MQLKTNKILKSNIPNYQFQIDLYVVFGFRFLESDLSVEGLRLQRNENSIFILIIFN